MKSKLREARERAGLSALALGEKSEIHEMRLYSFERKRSHPKPDEAVRLARALGTTPAALFPELATKGGGK